MIRLSVVEVGLNSGQILLSHLDDIKHIFNLKVDHLSHKWYLLSIFNVIQEGDQHFKQFCMMVN